MRARSALALGVLALGVVLGSPVGAHDEPGGHRLDVVLEPPVEGVEATAGPDGRVVLSATGHEVVLLGEAGEPWVRIRPDGAVEQNERSPGVTPGRATSAEEAPVWRQTGGGGRVQWLDAVPREEGTVARPITVDDQTVWLMATTTHEPVPPADTQTAASPSPARSGSATALRLLVASGVAVSAGVGAWLFSGSRRRPLAG